MRHFEQVMLVSEDGTRVITERRYSDNQTEYWATAVVQFNHNGVTGRADLPFRIEIPDAFDIEHGKTMDQDHFDAAMQAAQRDAAFANFQASFEAFRPTAEAKVMEQADDAAKKKHTKILLANAVPPARFHLP